MKHLKQLILLFSGVLLSTAVEAQKSETPNFKYNVGGNIEKMILTDSGVLLVTHGSGLAGIKPGQEGLVFNFDDYGKVKEEIGRASCRERVENRVVGGSVEKGAE